jgi:hypothetical protein
MPACMGIENSAMHRKLQEGPAGNPFGKIVKRMCRFQIPVIQRQEDRSCSGKVLRKKGEAKKEVRGADRACPLRAAPMFGHTNFTAFTAFNPTLPRVMTP